MKRLHRWLKQPQHMFVDRYDIVIACVTLYVVLTVGRLVFG